MDSRKNNKNFHTEKSISEFIDLSRVSAPNINEVYNKAFSKNHSIFRRTTDMFTEYYQLYKKYGNGLIDKPFQKCFKSDLEDTKNNIVNN